MSRETFIRGFVKAAEDRGVDPVALAKFAAKADGGNTGRQEHKTERRPSPDRK